MPIRTVLVFAAASAPLWSQEEVDESVLIERWESWSRDTIKAWQEAKVLHGNDLDKSKRLAAAIAVAWKRCSRAESVEEMLHAKHREQFDRLINAILDGSKKYTKMELDNLKKTIEGKLATINTAKNLFVSIKRDLEAMHLIFKTKLADAKTLVDPKKKAFEKNVLELKEEHDAFSAADLWNDGYEERATKAIAKIELLLKEL